MKKLALTIAIVLGMTIGAFAQGGGLFGKGETRGDAGEMNRGGALGIGLPDDHGGNGDVGAPLGSGAFLLIGFGAAYAMSKRRKE